MLKLKIRDQANIFFYWNEKLTNVQNQIVILSGSASKEVYNSPEIGGEYCKKKTPIIYFKPQKAYHNQKDKLD